MYVWIPDFSYDPVRHHTPNTSLIQKNLFAPTRDVTPPFYIRFWPLPAHIRLVLIINKIFSYIPGSLGYLVSTVDGYKYFFTFLLRVVPTPAHAWLLGSHISAAVCSRNM